MWSFILFSTNNVIVLLINARKQEWAIQIHWKHWAQINKKQRHNPTQKTKKISSRMQVLAKGKQVILFMLCHA